jgi:hypothetical protein
MTSSPTALEPPSAARRWIRRRTVPLPTWRLWIILGLLAIALLYLIGSRLHRWLAVVEPLADAPVLIVEGWAPDYVFQAAADYAEEHDCQLVVASGIPLDSGSYLTDFKNHAQVCVATMERLGFDKAKLRAAPAPRTDTERTRAMAVAVLASLSTEPNLPSTRRANLFTLGTHGRRSRRIYRDVMGASGWEIGVVSVPSQTYREATWYRQSAGAKTVVDELVALAVQSTIEEKAPPKTSPH